MTTLEKQAPVTAGAVRKRLRLPSLGLNTSERRLFLLIVDLVLINAALLFSVIYFSDLLPTVGAAREVYKWFVTLGIVWIAIATVFDCYNLARAASTAAITRAVAGAYLTVMLVYWLIPWLTPSIVNRSMVFGSVVLGLAGLLSWRVVYALVFVQPAFLRRALIVGAGQSGSLLVGAMQTSYAQNDFNPFRGTGYHVVGFVDDRPELLGTTIHNIPIIGSGADLATLVERLHIAEIIVAITRTHQIRPQLADALIGCREHGIPLVTSRDLYERLTGQVVLDADALGFGFFAHYQQAPLRRLYLMLRTLLDWVAGLVGLLLLGVLALPVLAINALNSPGPLFYRQVRIGQGGRPFTLIKFRSMVPDAEKHGAVWAAATDDRVTPIGRLLRASHLDELPQVINMLRGEMSLIGPRPERPEFVSGLARDIPFYRARHAVRPGLTGWAQVHQNYGDSVEGAREKLGYDLYYIKNASPLLDMSIMLRTVAKMIGLRGR